MPWSKAKHHLVDGQKQDHFLHVLVGNRYIYIYINLLVGGFNPLEKYATVKLDHFLKDRGENKIIFELPPPSLHW